MKTLCWLGVIGGDGGSQGQLDRRGLHMQGVVDLAAVDDERLGELVCISSSSRTVRLVSAAR